MGKYIVNHLKEMNHILNGWSKLLKIRLFSSSRLEFPTSMANKIYYLIKEMGLKINNLGKFVIENLKLEMLASGKYKIYYKNKLIYDPNNIVVYSNGRWCPNCSLKVLKIAKKEVKVINKRKKRDENKYKIKKYGVECVETRGRSPPKAIYKFVKRVQKLFKHFFSMILVL